jgi:hypothetical protein
VEAALHRHPRRDRRIDAAREEAEPLAERADRQAAGAREPADEDVGPLEADVDAERDRDRRGGPSGARRPRSARDHAVGDERSSSVDVSGRSVPAGGLDAEGVTRPPLEASASTSTAAQLAIASAARTTPRGRDRLDAEDLLQAHGDRFALSAAPRRPRRRSTFTAEMPRVASRCSTPGGLELPPVAALQGQLAVAHELGGGSAAASSTVRALELPAHLLQGLGGGTDLGFVVRENDSAACSASSAESPMASAGLMWLAAW